MRNGDRSAVGVALAEGPVERIAGHYRTTAKIYAAAARVYDANGIEEVERMDYLEFIARVVSHIPDKGQMTVRYYGLYANAHRGKVHKASLRPVALGLIEEELRPIPSKGWVVER
jgi:hypothetical protein